ncbi:alpha-N-acetylgalactosaminide alpha-2,6-sialyltransferase 1-like [Cololabis saira]|uniref:alpha-N-acetylgalactosaminide alpha-2,6-sialyltransferase 1-like n=1 Tax=Cololabis saira TaxID=129043 RepID=UPI002AD51AF0|nr:alpha-N-acetylgalactosaminide alpha-2,6-sialyltransferase 1-like [Cololabis saira]
MRGFCLLLVISIIVMLLFLSMEHLAERPGWPAFKGRERSRGEDGLFDSNTSLFQKKGAVFSPAHKTDLVESPKSSGFTTPKRDQRPKSPNPETPIPVISRKSFTKLPHWDFDDNYGQDAPPKHTKCSRSLRTSKDEAFQKAFLPNIRLFLHKDNINNSEWNRLSHFNNPFGFMDFKYEDVMPSLKLIPEPREPLLPPKPGGDVCIHCAVVGAGGILNGSKMGAEIDAHDYVFRVNGAVIKGHEEDVGNRTSVYVHTAHSITASLNIFKKYGYTSAPHDEGIKYVLIPEGMRDFQWLQGLLKGENVSTGQYKNKEPRVYYSGQYNESRFYVLHQDFLRYVRNRFLMSKNLNSTYWALVRPTNGAFSLFLALHTCDTVSAYGFMTEGYKKYSNYYFEKLVKSNVIFFINHDYNMEKDLWKSLHDRKIIKLYQGTGSHDEGEKLNTDTTKMSIMAHSENLTSNASPVKN